MREFRGKRVDNGGKWVYGGYCKIRDKYYIIPDDAWVVKIDYRNENFIRGFVEVIPETVGQSVGPKDKNGVKIYDGDRLDTLPDPQYNSYREFIRTVKWNADYVQFQATYEDDSGIDLFTKRQCLSYEVVGNIHEKPELLGDKK